MFSTTAPTDSLGISVLAVAARSAVQQLGGGAEIASLIVRLLADDAHARSTATEAPGPLQLFIGPHGTDGAGNVSIVRIPFDDRHELIDHSDLEVLAEESPHTDAPVTIRMGEVAVDEHGEVVAHWGAVFVTEGAVETGAIIARSLPSFARTINRLNYGDFGKPY